MQTSVQVFRLKQTLQRRAVALKQEICQRRVIESAFRESRRESKQLLAQSQRMQKQLRQLSHRLLQAHEDERKAISRELHDEVAQALTGIHVHLSHLKSEAISNAKGFEKRVSRTQRLVEKSVDVVHQFARDLRPTVLDDLGLIPALHSFFKEFAKRTGIHIRFTAFAGVTRLSADKRTVLYRVAQSALANVAQHANASQVLVSIRKFGGVVRMKVKDDGRGFELKSVLVAKHHNRLGLVGMQERMEMVGGSFSAESVPGQGTIIHVEVPLGQR